MKVPSLPKCHLWICTSHVTLPMSFGHSCADLSTVFILFPKSESCIIRIVGVVGFEPTHLLSQGGKPIPSYALHNTHLCACGEDLNLLSQFSCCQPLSAFIPIKLLKHLGPFVIESVTRPFKETRRFLMTRCSLISMIPTITVLSSHL